MRRAIARLMLRARLRFAVWLAEYAYELSRERPDRRDPQRHVFEVHEVFGEPWCQLCGRSRADHRRS